MMYIPPTLQVVEVEHAADGPGPLLLLAVPPSFVHLVAPPIGTWWRSLQAQQVVASPTVELGSPVTVTVGCPLMIVAMVLVDGASL